MKLENGYSIVEMTEADFFPQFGKIYDSLFGEHHTFFPDAYFSPEEKQKLEALKARMGNLFQLHLGLYSPENEFVGFSFGFQESDDTFYMAASAILPEHRGKKTL